MPEPTVQNRAGGTVAVVLKGYPRLSETFIAQEIRGLERRGLVLTLVSLRHPTDRARHPVHDEIVAPVAYLPEYLHREPGRVWRGWRAARRLAGYGAARATFLADLARDPTPNRVRRFGQACVMAAELPGTVTLLYCHFLHTPASVTRYAALMRGLPWCGSAHAKDIWTTPDWELAEKLADADWVTTCTRYGAERLRALAPDPGRVRLVYHGLDLAAFPPPPGARPARDGSDPADPVRLVSVGRAVAKKGYDDLLAALAALPGDLHWRFTHIGGGALARPLKAQAEALGLAGRIDWRGALPRDAVRAALRDADIFVLANRVAPDGDRDGLPNVLMEALSQELAVLASDVAATAELVEDGTTGVLVPPRTPALLARALDGLIRAPARRAALGRAGRADLEARFDAENLLDALAAQFDPSAKRKAA